MGFEKQQPLSSGFSVSYWSVQRLQINFSVKQASFTLLGYKDEETYRAGGAHATTRDINIRKPEDFDKFFPRNTEDNLLTQCYQAAAGMEPLFEDAEKV